MANGVIIPSTTENSKGLITPSITPTRNDLFRYAKRGNAVQIYINNVSFGQSMASDTKIGQVPYKPLYLTRFLLYMNDGSIAIGNVREDNGNILISGYSSGKLLYGSFTYLTDE